MRRHKRKPDRAYLGWIAGFPCFCCVALFNLPPEFQLEVIALGSIPRLPGGFLNRGGPTEVAHVGDRGLMQKCSDRETIPLCAEHHRTGKDAHHVLGKRFWAHHGLDRDALVAELQRRYDAEVAAA